MSKVELDSSNLKANCLLYINDTIKAISTAMNYYEQMNVPYDFSRRYELRNIYEELSNIKKSLQNTYDWIVDSNKDYNTLIDNLSTQAGYLSVDQITRRNNII